MKLFVTILLLLCTLIGLSEAPQCQCDDLRKEYAELRREVNNLKEEFQRLKSRVKHERKCKENHNRRCLQNYMQLGHSCYRFIYNPLKTMKGAKRFCRENNGAHLVAINKIQELERLYKHIKKYTNNMSNIMFHTSGVLENPLTVPGTGSGEWVWKPWNKPKVIHPPVEPISDDSNSMTSIEQCLVLKIERGGILVPGDCHSKLAFICELPFCHVY